MIVIVLHVLHLYIDIDKCVMERRMELFEGETDVVSKCLIFTLYAKHAMNNFELVGRLFIVFLHIKNV